MFQWPRDAKQDELFGIALKGEVCISNLYSHPKCWLLKQTSLPVGYPAGFTFPPDTHANQATYEGRGWVRRRPLPPCRPLPSLTRCAPLGVRSASARAASATS